MANEDPFHVCLEKSPDEPIGYLCSRAKGHEGDHEAGGTKGPYRWPRDEEETVEVSRVCSTDEEPVHMWFGLSYANYLTINRTLLQSMPLEWQRRFVRCLEELDAAAGHLPHAEGYNVSTRKFGGQFMRDPIPRYDRGRARVPLKRYRG